MSRVWRYIKDGQSLRRLGRLVLVACALALLVFTAAFPGYGYGNDQESRQESYSHDRGSGVKSNNEWLSNKHTGDTGDNVRNVYNSLSSLKDRSKSHKDTDTFNDNFRFWAERFRKYKESRGEGKIFGDMPWINNNGTYKRRISTTGDKQDQLSQKNVSGSRELDSYKVQIDGSSSLEGNSVGYSDDKGHTNYNKDRVTNSSSSTTTQKSENGNASINTTSKSESYLLEVTERVDKNGKTIKYMLRHWMPNILNYNLRN